jgi:glycine/D-amino acid oxidase-like deaminating enzyme
MNKKRVAVIGAGMVGACVARYLQRDGHDVVMIDPLGPGEGASYGNAGCFNPSSLVPIAGPDTFRQVPKYLMDPLGPLSIRWSYLPELSPWLIRAEHAAVRNRDGAGHRCGADRGCLKRRTGQSGMFGLPGSIKRLTRQQESNDEHQRRSRRTRDHGWCCRRAHRTPESAIIHFETVLRERSNDRPASVLLERCRHFRQSGVDQEWSPVAALKTK